MRRVTRYSAKCGEDSKYNLKVSKTATYDDNEDDHTKLIDLKLSSSKKGKSKTVENKYSLKNSKTKIQNRKSLDESKDEEIVLVNVLSTPKKGRSKTAESDLVELSPSTPPKQTKRDQFQHSKDEEFENCQTPSTLLRHLTLSSPNGDSKNKSKKKCLFKENGELENTEEDIEVNNKTNNVYRNARRALHSSLPTRMPGREVELDLLKKWITVHRANRKSGSLYISGPPGTGKTAALTVVLESKDVLDKFTKVYVNCTTIKSPKAVYSRISKELNIKCSGKTEKEYISAVENYLKKSKSLILLILDEIDQLESKNQSILYTIFEWPSKLHFQILLIGIANALDLTDRILPRLQARCALKPELMHFAPYTKEQIIQILTSRLQEAGVLEVFSPIALQMLAGKVAAISGDVRRALDIARRVIELVDHSRSNETLSSIENITSDVIKGEMKAVEYKEVLNVLNNIYGTSQTLTTGSEDTFPLQQKIAICSLILMLRKAKNKDITIGRLHDVYRRVCLKRKITAVDQSEFVSLCSLIETRGIIRVSKKKETRLHKVLLEWDEGEISAVLKDKQLMSTIIQDESCLGNY